MKLIAIGLTALLMAGCATTNTLQPGKADSTKLTIKGKTYDQVWKASVKAMSNQLTIVERSKENGVIKA